MSKSSQCHHPVSHSDRAPPRSRLSALRLLLSPSASLPTMALYFCRFGSFCLFARVFFTLRSGLSDEASKSEIELASSEGGIIRVTCATETHRTTMTGTGLWETQYLLTLPIPGAPSAAPNFCNVDRDPFVPTIRAGSIAFDRNVYQ